MRAGAGADGRAARPAAGRGAASGRPALAGLVARAAGAGSGSGHGHDAQLPAARRGPAAGAAAGCRGARAGHEWRLPRAARRAGRRCTGGAATGQSATTGAGMPDARAGGRGRRGAGRRTHSDLVLHPRRGRATRAGALPRRLARGARGARSGPCRQAVPADHREHHRPDFPAYPGGRVPRCLAGQLDAARLLAGTAAWAWRAGPAASAGPQAADAAGRRSPGAGWLPHHDLPHPPS